MKKKNQSFLKIKAAKKNHKKAVAMKTLNPSTNITFLSKIKKYISLISLNLRIES
jgi:hypothetical protein